MMDERQVVEETMGYLRAEQRLLRRELTRKKEEYKKMEISFAELSFIPFLRKIFQRKFKSFMWMRLRNLEEEIPVLRETLNQFTQAIADLEQGIYDTTIPLFNQMTSRYFRPLLDIESTDSTFNPKPTFGHILNLKKQLISLHETER